MILATDRSKLSKRHGAVSLESYKDAGYLPEAMINYLVLLGWAPNDDREIVTMEEMISEFDIVNVNKSGAIFDVKKLEWMNGEYIRAIELDELISRLKAVADVRYENGYDSELFKRAVELAQPRATTFNAMLDQMDSLFAKDFSIEQEQIELLKHTDQIQEILKAVEKHLHECDWNLEGIDLREVVNAIGLKPRKALPAVYLIIEGSTSGLPLFDFIEMLGRDESLSRIRNAKALLA